MKKRIIILKILLVIVKAINPLFAEPLYHLTHLGIAYSYGIYRFGQQKVIFFMIAYLLVLELITEKFIFSKSARNSFHQQGKEVIEMVKEEIGKCKY